MRFRTKQIIPAFVLSTGLNFYLCAMESNLNTNERITLKDRTHEAVRITWTGFSANLALSVGKIMAGVFGKSSAMLADGIHSLSDFFTDLIVIIFIRISAKKEDRNHHYGHGKYETLATLIISLMLMVAAGALLYEGACKTISSLSGTILPRPTCLALIAALISIGIKEWLYRITAKVGRKIKSDAVIANGWHHRSDAFSSVGTFLGISGAMFLSERWRILDPIASILVSLLILKVAFQLFKPAIEELLEKALPDNIEKEIGDIIGRVPEVRAFHNLKTRKSGNNYIIDVHIKIDPHITVVAAHDIASGVEDALTDRFGEGTRSSIHTEPYFRGEIHDQNKTALMP